MASETHVYVKEILLSAKTRNAIDIPPEGARRTPNTHVL